MSKIKNYPNQADETVEAVRSAIEFRATWFALLFDEMRKAGVDAEGITRRAIRRCGREVHGVRASQVVEGRQLNGNEMKAFSFNDLMKKVFIMDPVTSDENNADAYLHYCPLVAAWQKMGFSDEDIDLFDAAVRKAHDDEARHVEDSVIGGDTAVFHPIVIDEDGESEGRKE